MCRHSLDRARKYIDQTRRRKLAAVGGGETHGEGGQAAESLCEEVGARTGTVCRAEMLLGLRQSEGEDKGERETLHSG